MNRSVWQLAKEIFELARERPPGEREEFVENRCGGDEVLRAEVEKLLGAYDSEFLEENVLGTVEALAEPHLPLGQVIGRYCIKELIGTGGMGQVFLADDNELDRPVAFKVLHSDVAEDQERVRRFVQEAKAASALNHPNILTIHEIGSFEGSRFIVSEYIDGDTLRERMRAGLTVADSVEITYQIAAALKAAHAAGIVHRDIKPENVMIRNDGLVKVLDFGLAKLTEADDQPMGANAPVSRLQTSPGLIMGTVAYMSPEQARGQAVDARTDLWSLGVVLHEMLTGKSPFEGESITELVSSILSTDSTPANIDSLPPELTPICQKALTKEKDKRYQSAHDLLEDLKGEKKRMEYAIQQTPFITVSSTDELKTQLIRRRPTLSAEYIVQGVKRHKYATFVSILAVVTFGVGLSVYRYNAAPQTNPAASTAAVITSDTTDNDLKMARFAISDLMREAVISPDGKYVAYIVEDGPTKSPIRLRHLETNKESVLVPGPEVGRLQNISFTHDVSHIYYVLNTPNNEEIFRLPISGGTAAKIADKTDGGGSLSPDGKSFVFQRDPKGETIYLANPDGTGERVLLDRPGDDWVYCGSVPVWSSDSKWLACSEHFKTKDEEGYKLVLVNAATGELKAVSDRKWREISGCVFMPEGSLIIAGKDTSSDELVPSQLWHIDTKGGAKQITNDLIGYSTLSATQKGDVLLTIQQKLTLDIWSMPVGDASRTRQITNSGEVWYGFDYTPSGKLLFISNVSGNADIWQMDNDGSNRSQLTANRGSHVYATMSPDGRFIVYGNRTDLFATHVFRADADGKNPVQLTNGLQEWTPVISHDSKWVYYVQAHGDGKPLQVCRVPIDGGEPTVIATAPPGGGMGIHDVSRKDGRLAVEMWRTPRTKRTVTLLSPTGRTTGSVELPPSALVAASTNAGFVRWTPDGRYLAFIGRTDTSTSITAIPANGKGPSKTLLTLPGRIGTFRFSPDAKQLSYVNGIRTRDAVVITNKRN